MPPELSEEDLLPLEAEPALGIGHDTVTPLLLDPEDRGQPRLRGRRQQARECPEREAERELLAATREDANQVEAFALLGNLYARRKMNARAAASS